jgi:hypothetical protein
VSCLKYEMMDKVQKSGNINRFSFALQAVGGGNTSEFQSK